MKRKTEDSNLIYNKKGNVLLESGFIIIVLVALVFISIGAYMAFEAIQDELSTDDDLATEALNISTELYDRYDTTLDGIFAWALGLLWIIVIILSFFIDSHPAFYIISIILLVGLLIAATYISNAYEEFENDDDFGQYVGNFPKMNYIMNNLLMVFLVIGGSIALALYAKSRIG